TPWFQTIAYLGNPVDYNVIMEPTNRNWLYTLQMPRIQHDGMMMRRDYQVVYGRRLNQRFSYDARSYLQYRADANSSDADLRRSRSLPPGNNPQARQFAEQLRSTVSSDRAYMEAVLAHFRNEEFFYT